MYSGTTLLVPNNAAFDTLSANDLSIWESGSSGIGGHMILKEMSAQDLIDAGTAEILMGNSPPVTIQDGTMVIGNATVLCGNIDTASGTIFLLDAVLS